MTGASEPVSRTWLVSPEGWKRLEPLLDAALALPAERRRAYLDAACGGDEALRAALERMLAGCDEPDPLLDRPAAERFAALLTETPRDDAAGDGPGEPPNESGALPEALAERFHVTRELGRGGMATVYLAHDVRHDREVAVKMLRPSLGIALGADRFLSEIRVTANLRHPHILPLFDSGEHDGRLYYVMPYVEGGSLRERLDRDGPLSPTRAARIAGQIAAALADAHAHGIVHRDIKPENILLTPDGDHAYLADFGIALAATADPRGRPTRPGFVLGTPAYMSPEQLRGERDLDGRSDVYSLGCVLHEMLAGRLPGDGATPDEGSPVHAVAARATAAARADRYQTAGELAHALEAAVATPAPFPARRPRWRAAAAGVAALAAAAVATTVYLTRADRDGAVGVDAETVAVLPFRHDAGASAPALSGDNCARLLYDALARWQSLRLSDEMRVADAVRGGGMRLDTLSVDGARALARRLGARRFVWGAVSSFDGVLRVRAQLYEPGKADPVTHVVTVASTGDVAAAFVGLADSLVALLAGTPAAAPAAVGTRNFDALKHYADGYAALHAWDTPAAERHFRAALDRDPHFAQAGLALAQSMAWSTRYRPTEWHDPAARAVADSARLGPRDRVLAGALLALAEARPGDACDAYRGLVARAPGGGDFAAQYGLGQCLSYDRLVIRDPADARRWRFRASRAEAVAAYERALQLVPSYFEAARGGVFAALAGRVLVSGESEFRSGFALAPDTVWMGAFPELVGDTVTYHPVPVDTLFRGTAPPTHRAAVAHDRETRRALTRRWTEAHPRSAAAWLHHAEALEALGMLEATAPGAPGALHAATRARALADADTTVRAGGIAVTAAAEARVLLKLRRYEQARAVADAALADSARAAATLETDGAAEMFAALAALTGRARLAARLLERAVADTTTPPLFGSASGGDTVPPMPVLRAAGAFAAYASLAAPAESLRASRARAERAIDEWTPAAARDGVRALTLARSSMLAQPTLGAAALRGLHEPEPYDDLLALWQTLARGDSATVRARLRAAAPSPIAGAARAPDWLVQRAQLALAVGDTATAVAALDEIMTSLPDQWPRLTREVAAAAALGRALVLRARLPGGPAAPAARAVAALWSNADPELRAIAASLPARQR